MRRLQAQYMQPLFDDLVRDQGAGGSNPLSPTILFLALGARFIDFRFARRQLLSRRAGAQGQPCCRKAVLIQK